MIIPMVRMKKKISGKKSIEFIYFILTSCTNYFFSTVYTLRNKKACKNFERRHKQFKRYFSIQHPYLPVPSQKTHPNWKIDPFLNNLNLVFMQAVHLPECISCDEQTIGFHGRLSLKQRIKFKKNR